MGRVPASEVQDYALEVAAYTSDRGHLYLEFAGHAPCHDAERVIEAAAYKPEADLPNNARLGLLLSWRRLHRQVARRPRHGARKGRSRHLSPLASSRRRVFRPHVTKGQFLCHMLLV